MGHKVEEERDDLNGQIDEERKEDTKKKEETKTGMSVDQKPMENDKTAEFQDDGNKNALEDGKGAMDELEEGVDDGGAEVKGLNAAENGGKQNEIFDGIHFQELTKKLRTKKRKGKSEMVNFADDEDEDDGELVEEDEDA